MWMCKYDTIQYDETLRCRGKIAHLVCMRVCVCVWHAMLSQTQQYHTAHYHHTPHTSTVLRVRLLYVYVSVCVCVLYATAQDEWELLIGQTDWNIWFLR